MRAGLLSPALANRLSNCFSFSIDLIHSLFLFRFQIETDNDGLVVTADGVINPRKINIDVNDVDLCTVQQIIGDEDVIQYLGVALEVKGIDVVIVEEADQIGQHSVWSRAGQDLGEIVGKLKRVQIA
jgi:hypothetical protein